MGEVSDSMVFLLLFLRLASFLCAPLVFVFLAFLHGNNTDLGFYGFDFSKTLRSTTRRRFVKSMTMIGPHN